MDCKRRAAKIILKQKYDFSGSLAIKTLNWMKTETRIKFHSVLYINKSLNGLASTLSSERFSFVRTRTSARLNDNKKLILLKPNNNFYINSLFYKGIQVYNDLDYNIRNTDNFKSFKRLSYNHFKNID